MVRIIGGNHHGQLTMVEQGAQILKVADTVPAPSYLSVMDQEMDSGIEVTASTYERHVFNWDKHRAQDFYLPFGMAFEDRDKAVREFIGE